MNEGLRNLTVNVLNLINGLPLNVYECKKGCRNVANNPKTSLNEASFSQKKCLKRNSITHL